MPKPCSLELRERVVDAVESGASRREAADWFDVSPSSAIKWMQRRQATGSIAPKPSWGSTVHRSQLAAAPAVQWVIEAVVGLRH
jgi:transposase